MFVTEIGNCLFIPWYGDFGIKPIFVNDQETPPFPPLKITLTLKVPKNVTQFFSLTYARYLILNCFDFFQSGQFWPPPPRQESRSLCQAQALPSRGTPSSPSHSYCPNLHINNSLNIRAQSYESFMRLFRPRNKSLNF
jgi:hypothetical protein